MLDTSEFTEYVTNVINNVAVYLFSIFGIQFQPETMNTKNILEEIGQFLGDLPPWALFSLIGLLLASKIVSIFKSTVGISRYLISWLLIPIMLLLKTILESAISLAEYAIPNSEKKVVARITYSTLEELYKKLGISNRSYVLNLEALKDVNVNTNVRLYSKFKKYINT